MIGRIKFLTVSIKTINGISAAGVPLGTVCANMCVVLVIQPNIIKDSHSGKARVNVIVKWLDEVKIYGNNPMVLLITIKKRRANNKIVDPLKEWGPIKILNSLWRDRFILYKIMFFLLGRSQNIGNNIIKKIIDLSQFKEELNEVEGSNEENKFVIIFSGYYRYFLKEFGLYLTLHF